MEMVLVVLVVAPLDVMVKAVAVKPRLDVMLLTVTVHVLEVLHVVTGMHQDQESKEEDTLKMEHTSERHIPMCYQIT